MAVTSFKYEKWSYTSLHSPRFGIHIRHVDMFSMRWSTGLVSHSSVGRNKAHNKQNEMHQRITSTWHVSVSLPCPRPDDR